jgi:hypothetical protein
MRAILRKCAAAAATGAVIAGAASAEGLGLGASAGSDGIGADAFYKLNSFVVARGGFRYAGIELSREIDDVDYDLDIGFTSGVAALDIHPFANGFRLSAGAYFGAHDLDLMATPAASVEIGDQTFTPAEVGVVTGASDWNEAAPFFGLGFNNAHNGGRVGFQAMLGAMYLGAPDVALQATGGLLANDPDFLAELAVEKQRLEDDLDDIQFYPILSLGLTVRF